MSSIEQKARDVSRPTLESVGRTLARWNVSPDAVTYLGLLLTIGVAVLAALGEIRWAGVAYIVAALCDALDGTLARVSGKGSRFGAFLDSTIDRFEESIVFLGLSIHYARVVPGDAWGMWVVPLILVAVVGSLMVSYTRARAEGVGVECKAGFMTRPPRVAILIVAMVLDLAPIGLAIIAATSLLTTFQRMFYVWRMIGREAGGGATGTPSSLSDPGVEQESRNDDAGKGDEL
ncbi:MAG: CDP-alcohol phosphatidyltransferase family protein [Anaerolineae bacterium]|nr:CDP-alcohol phosphatidyltransferase family protein [Anaerolineae bacterium]